MDVEAMKLMGKYLGAGIASIGMMGAAIGVGLIFAAALNGIARNPSQEAKIRGLAFVGMALAEAMGIFAFLVAALLLFYF